MACSGDKPESSAELTSEKLIPGFASGSGMAMVGGRYYTAGDDDAFLHILGSAGEVIDKIQLWDSSNVVNGRILKPVKPDFEAIAAIPFNGDTALIIFSSGSKSPQRDVLMLVNPNTSLSPERLPADTAFFAWLRRAADLGKKEMNLEGAAFGNGELLLLNRQNNELYRIPGKGFEHFLTSGTTDNLSLERRRFVLPSIEGDSARFSGASTLPGGLIIFSASVEVTDNAIDDGKVKGSFIGLLDLSQERSEPQFCARVMRPDGTPFTGKIEAVEGRRNPDGSVTASGITDNDDGTTYWIKAKLQSK
ncbi:MAG: hypothetical protein ABR572_10510 [Cryomorphaceae bacterium]|nr:hypothetical protein [Flavobacteriales bacterium]